jgi:hypothetical protein
MRRNLKMARKKKKLKVEDVQEEQEKKPLMSFPEACILVTTVALLIGIAMILMKQNANFG